MTSPDPKETFRQEAQDLLVQLESALLDLEHTPGDSALIDTAFRALHTIKGSGSMFGFDAVAAFTHHVENAFDKVRQGKAPPSRELIAVALRARDHMRHLIENPDAADVAEGEAILADLRQIFDAPSDAPESAAPAAAPALATWRLRMWLPRDVIVNGAARCCCGRVARPRHGGGRTADGQYSAARRD
jgi:two-component system chemotaxis sensor kinase CheA